MSLVKDRAFLILTLIAILLVVLGFFLSKSSMALATEFLCVLTIAMMWNLLAGFSGIVLMGIPLFIGTGGYTLYILANTFQLPPYPAVIGSAFISALLAFALAPLLFRLQGAQLAIGSWVTAEIARLIALISPALGSGGGLNLEVMKLVNRSWRMPLNYTCAAVVMFTALIVTMVLMRRRFGLGLRAMRDSEAAAQAMGVDTRRIRLITLVLAAALTGAAGGAYYITTLQISPNSAFSTNWIAMVIFIVILGGIGSIEGPIIGALVYFFLRETFSELGTGYFILTGALAMGVTIFMPEGLWGLLRKVIGFDLLPVSREPITQNQSRGEPLSQTL